MHTINLITGSAGFIGTNLVAKLLAREQKVIGIDNFSSSEKWKADLFKKDANYTFIEADICNRDFLFKKLELGSARINRVFNLACPASPPRYQKLAIETINVCTTGLINILDVARQNNAQVFHASTSEVYGDPLEHPQKESYRGNVNTVGPRSCYDEGKRIAESICYEYSRIHKLDIKLGRIFNTYGPFMDPEDGRVITNFIRQALSGEKLTVYGNGKQTRSFIYIDDLLSGILKLIDSKLDPTSPVNLGNPEEFTILELIEKLKQNLGKELEIEFSDLPKDDPLQRKPDISLARSNLGWEPRTRLQEGLPLTINYYKQHLSNLK